MGQIQEVSYYSNLPVKFEPTDVSPSAGPIIEQGTHFCDLSRYFGGDVDISSVQAHSLEWHEKAGRLSKMAVNENAIPPENRIPRVTAATWYELLIYFCVPQVD